MHNSAQLMFVLPAHRLVQIAESQATPTPFAAADSSVAVHLFTLLQGRSKIKVSMAEKARWNEHVRMGMARGAWQEGHGRRGRGKLRAIWSRRSPASQPC